MKERLDFIDGLRGLAALLVVVAHSWIHTDQYTLKVNNFTPSNYLGFGYLGVNLFMVISGFSLTYALVSNVGWNELNVADFYRRRVLRIVPPYYAAILLFTLLSYLTPAIYRFFNLNHASAFEQPNLVALITYPLFIHNPFTSIATTINGSFWSLELEVQFYLLFPILVYLARRYNVLNMVGLALFLSIVWRMFIWSNFNHTDAAVQVWLAWSGPGRVFEFALGMLAAYIMVRYQQYVNSAITLLLSVALIWLSVFYIINPLGQFFPIVDIVVGVSFFMLVLSGVGGGLAHRFFTFRPLVWLGNISYSLYLIHEPFIRELYTWFPKLQGTQAFVVYTIAFSLVVIVLAWLFYLMVERPFIKLGRKLIRERREAAKMQAETHAAP